MVGSVCAVQRTGVMMAVIGAVRRAVVMMRGIRAVRVAASHTGQKSDCGHNLLYVKEGCRVDWGFILLDFQMAMGARCNARRTYMCNHLPRLDGIPRLYHQIFTMGIQRVEAVPVVK